MYLVSRLGSFSLGPDGPLDDPALPLLSTQVFILYAHEEKRILSHVSSGFFLGMGARWLEGFLKAVVFQGLRYEKDSRYFLDGLCRLWVDGFWRVSE